MAGKKQKVTDEEMALRLVNLYFEEIARIGFKRSLDLDSIVNAYFYSLRRLQNKTLELKLMEKSVEKEESELERAGKKELFPGVEPASPVPKENR